MLTLFACLLVAHALADYPLQGDFLARAKNPWAPLPGVPWTWAMGAHCAIHAGAVAWLTGAWFLGVAEFIAHAATDLLKCRGRISFSVDQWAHIAAKACWAVIAGAVAAC